MSKTTRNKIDVKGFNETVAEPVVSKNLAEFAGTVIAATLKFQTGLISERSRRLTGYAMRKHQANGRRMSKILPYGYSEDPSDSKRMIPNPDEQKIVKRILELHDRGFGLRRIARTITNEGLKPRKVRKKIDGRTIYVESKGWQHHTIKAIIRRECVDNKEK
ncbi:MAG: recombinase family protein [Planctomycetes bacterium]|nr:recombinase family protein [Planctomycetota bacterium]